MKILRELKRRKVYRVAAAYAVVAWLLIQIATQVFPFFDIPGWAIRLVIVVLCLGFPGAVILAWIFDITPQGIRRTDQPGDAPTADTRAKSIAVLPFENLSDNKENEYFAAGVHDDILSNLAKVADLKVISRTSVQQFKSGARDVREIAGTLGVAHILQGTVRRAGNRVRVNTQLIDARSDTHLWAESFDREIVDLFSLQSDLAEKITAALRASLSPVEKTGLRTHPTRDMGAYALFIQARELFHWAGTGDSQDNGAEALRLIDEAVGRDPQFALAYALASRIHSELFWFGYDKSPARLESAKSCAQAALRVQPDLGEAHLANAFYYYYGFRRYDLARTHVLAAMRAVPNDSEVLNTAGAIDRREGRWEEALRHLERARELDPHNVSVLWNLFETYLALHRYTEADAAATEALSLAPRAYFFFLGRAAIPLFRNGETAPLRSALQRIPADFDPGGAVTTAAVRVSLMEGDYAAAEKALAACTRPKLNDNGLTGIAAALDGYTVPKEWLVGLVARGRGNESDAREAFEIAKRIGAWDARQSPDDAKTAAMLALIHAALGEKQDAEREADRAASLLPVERDTFDGPFIVTARAVVLAGIGEHARALAELEKVAGLPNGPTAGSLRLEREWDPLRKDPRFIALIKRLR